MRFHTVLTFSIFIILFASISDGQVVIQKPENVNYCSLLDPSKNYEGRIVKTSAFMSYSTVGRIDGGDTFLYSTVCNDGDYFATTDFSRPISSKWQKFFKKLPSEKNYLFEIEFIGKPHISIVPTFGHLSWARAEMEIIEILSIKDITSLSNTEKPDEEAKTPLKNKGGGLQTINTAIMFYFMSGKKSPFFPDAEYYISDNFSMIDRLGRKFDKKNYQKLIEAGLFNEIKDVTLSVDNGEVKKLNGETYMVLGEIWTSLKDEKKEVLNYENTFWFSENAGWMLVETKFSKH